MNAYRIISADSHANEPYNIYQRLPKGYRHRAPHVVTQNGARYLIVEGRSPQPIESPNPLNEDDQHRYWRQGEQVGRVVHRAGGTDVPLRLADQELDGVSAEVIYPQAVFRAFTSPDPAFQLAMARVCNDWFHEIFFDNPDRFVVSGLVPVLDIEDGIAEARWMTGFGYRSISVPVSIPSRPYNLPAYEPLWTALEDMGVSVSFHVFTRGESVRDTLSEDQEQNQKHGEDLFGSIMGMAEAMSPLTMLVASGVLHHHPGLRFVLVECGTGWLAWVLQTMDEMHHKRHMWERPRLEMLPSHYFKRQGHITFGDDLAGLQNRNITGVDCLLWGSDYPHDEGTFPHSREVIERTFRDLTEEEKRKIAGENAARLYGL